jgi:hypothetical protein
MNTVAFDGTEYKPKPKPFAWSYSKLKNFEVCPKRHYNVDVLKSFKEEEGEALVWGNMVHKALADRCKDGKPLPHTMQGYEKWAERVTFPGKPGDPPATIMTEQQLAIDEDFGPTKWFATDAKRSGQGEPWYRGIADVLKINGNGTRALAVDWKTGKVIDDAPQLALLAACIFAHHPKVEKVRSEFIWLKEDASTRKDFERNGMAAIWRGLWPRIEALRSAHETSTYPAKPGYLCRRYCPVTSCPHHGEE